MSTIISDITPFLTTILIVNTYLSGIAFVQLKSIQTSNKMKFISSISITVLATLVTGIALPDAGTPNIAAANLEKRTFGDIEDPTIYCHNGEGWCDKGKCYIPISLTTHKLVDDAACKNTTNTKL